MRLRLQKFTPIDREHPIYEVVDDERNVLLDVTRSSEGDWEILMHSDSVGRVLPLTEVMGLIARARRLLEEEG